MAKLTVIKRICPVFDAKIDEKVVVQTTSGKMNPNNILVLRGLYDSTHETSILDNIDSENITEQQLQEIGAKLQEFYSEVNKNDLEEQEKALMQKSNDIIAKAFIDVDKHFKGEQKIHRIKLIANLVYEILEEVKKELGAPNTDYKTILDEYYSDISSLFKPNKNSSAIAKKFNVFQDIYNKFNYYCDLEEEGSWKGDANVLDSIINGYSELIDPNNQEMFDSLCILALSEIKEFLDLKIDPSFGYAEETEDIDYTDIIANITEEVKKDGWQEKNDEVSSFSRMSKAVRKILYRIPKIKRIDGNPIKQGENFIIEKDDLNNSIYYNPNYLHRLLIETVRHCDTEEDFKKELIDNFDNMPEFEYIYNRLIQNKSLLSKFFREYYSLTNVDYLQKTNDSVITLTGKYSSKNTLFNNYLTRINNIFNKNSIYIKKGREAYIDPVKFKEFSKFIKELMEEPLSLESTSMFTRSLSKSKFDKSNKLGKKKAIKKTLDYLNIKYTEAQIDALIVSRKYKDIMNDIYNIIGNNYITDKNISDNNATFIINLQVGDDKVSLIADTLTKVLNTLDKHEDTKSTHRVNYHGKKLFNDILPSTWSNIIDKFKTYLDSNQSFIDYSKFKEHIKKLYLNSSQFSDTAFRVSNGNSGKIYNRLLSDMYQSKELHSIVAPIIANLKISEVLGNADVDFSDFLEGEHLDTLALMFFGNMKPKHNIQYISESDYLNMSEDKKIYGMKYYIIGKPYYYKKGIVNPDNTPKPTPREQYAKFSTFILGDNNKLKTTTHPVYSYEECVQGLIDIALSEINYAKQKTALKEKMNKKGMNSLPEGKVFGFLNFLNAKYPDISKIEVTESLEKEIKTAVKKFLSSEIADIQEQLLSSTVVVEKINKIYGENTTEAVSDFVANYALSLACIQQMTIISPTLFKTTKDQQKRNKGILANGKMLHTAAYNPYTQEYLTSEDRYQKVLIAKDIELSSNEIDPKFVEYAEKILGKEGVKNYIKDISLTDGQGYRLIDSYYKIRLMLGEESEELNNWYFTYKRLQKQMKEDKRTSFNSEEIKELQATGYIPQPLKPLTQAVTREKLNDNDEILIAQQHKYAEIILIPELLPEQSRLKAIGEAMQGNNTEANKIDLFIFNTGVKVGSYAEIDVYNDKEDTQIGFYSLKDRIDEHASKHLHYVDLKQTKMQSNTPLHIDEQRGIGTQMQKIITQSINLSKIYNKILPNTNDSTTIKISKNKSVKVENFKGKELVNLINSLWIANYLENYSKFLNVIKDKKTVSKILINNTVLGARGDIEDILAYSLNADGSSFYNPIFDNIREHDSSGAILSVFRKIVNKQKTYGGSFVQASAFGISSKDESENLHYIYDDNGRAIGAECEISWNLYVTNSNGKRIPLKYEDYCHENGELKTNKDGIPLLDIDYPGIRNLIAYRIPTEEFYSMMNLTAVRFSRPMVTGGTIKVPLQGVAQAGFDFDIDKLYFMKKDFVMQDLDKAIINEVWKEVYKNNPDIYRDLNEARGLDRTNDLESYWGVGVTKYLNKEEEFNRQLLKLYPNYSKFVQYDYDLTPMQNSREARNNLLFDIIFSRMQDEETAFKRLTTGGFDSARKAARVMRELIFKSNKHAKAKSIKDVENNLSLEDPEPNYSPLSIRTLLIYNKMNQIADKLIGVFANHNSNTSMVNLVEKFSFKSPIRFGSMLEDVSLYRNGQLLAPLSVGSDLLADTIVYSDGTKANIPNRVREFLAASVDAVKDPVLNYLGITPYNATVGTLLVRLGYSMNDVGLLFNQPIVQRIINNPNPHLEIYAIQREFANNTYSEIILTEEVLMKGMTEEYNEVIQYNVFKLFTELQARAGIVNDIVKATKNTASKSISSEFSSIYANISKLKRALSKLVGNSELNFKPSSEADLLLTDEININNYEDYEDYIEDILVTPYALEQCAYDANKGLLGACSDIYPYETPLYRNIRNIAEKVAMYSLSDETIAGLHAGIILATLANRGNSYFNSNKKMFKSNGEPVAYKYYIINEFPKILSDILTKTDVISNKYKFFDLLSLDTVESGGVQKVVIKIKNRIAETKIDNAEISALFEEAFYSEDKIVRDIAHSLVMYDYFTTGFIFENGSFSNVFTPSVIHNLIVNAEGETYNDVLQMLLEDNAVDINPLKFLDLYVSNNPYNEELVKQTFRNKNISSIGGVLVVPKDDSKFRLPIKEAVKNKLVAMSQGVVVKQITYLLINDRLYKNVTTEFSAPGYLEYVEIDVLNDNDYSISETKENVLSTSDYKEPISVIEYPNTTNNTNNNIEFTDKKQYTVEQIQKMLEEEVPLLYNEFTEQEVYLTYAVFTDIAFEKAYNTSKQEIYEKLTELYNEEGAVILVMNINEETGQPEIIKLC